MISQQPWRSTQEDEGTPLERVQVVNSGARVQIPPSPFELENKKSSKKMLTRNDGCDSITKLSRKTTAKNLEN